MTADTRHSLGPQIGLLVASLLFLVTPFVYAEDIWTEEDVATYFASGVWDWRVMDRREFTTYWGEPIQPPWETDATLGIPVGGANLPDPRKGWRLYERHLNCADYGQPNAPCTPEEEGVSTVFPHFSLYNIYTGTLRTLIYPHLPGGLGNDIRFAVTSDVVQGPGYTGFHTIGLFLNKGQYATSWAERDAELSRGYSTIMPAYPKWIAVDRILSYDPSDPPPDLGITFRIHGLREDQLSISGILTETTNTTESEHPHEDLLSYIDFVGGAYGAVSSAVKTVDSNLKLAEELDKRSDTLNNKGYTDLSSAVAAVADVVIVPGTAIAAIVGASGIVSAFVDLLGGKSTQYTPKTFEAKLDGTLSGERGLELFKIGIHHSVQTTEPGYTPTLSYQGNMGLFALATKPRYEAGDDYVRFLDKDLSSLVLLNPHSNMELITLEVQPIVSVPPTMEARSDWVVDNSTYDRSSKRIPGLVSEEFGFSKVVTTAAFEDPASIDFRWDPRDGLRVHDPSIGVVDNSTTRRILLKIHFKFQHIDPAHADIVADFVQTYQTELTTQSCSEGPSKKADTWHANSLIHGYVLTNMIGHWGQYTHRPCNMPWGHAIMFTHSHYRGVNQQLHHPRDPVGRLEIAGDLPRLEGTDVGDDAVSSLMIAPFTEVTLYNRKDYGGKSETFYGDNVPYLSVYGWNDKARSVRVRDTGAWAVPLIF